MSAVNNTNSTGRGPFEGINGFAMTRGVGFLPPGGRRAYAACGAFFGVGLPQGKLNFSHGCPSLWTWIWFPFYSQDSRPDYRACVVQENWAK